MKCLNCGHEHTQHNLHTDRRCRVRTLTGWSADDEKYTGFQPCLCEGYRGVEPGHACPHEFLPKGGCVFCGAARVQR
jgi:hypothetical protein